MLIVNAVVITMNDENEVHNPGWIRIREGLIVGIGGEEEIPTDLRDDEILDAGGNVAIPGLINTHVHCFQTLLRGVYDHLPLPEYLSYVYTCGTEMTDADARWAARLAAAEAVLTGVTTVVDHHFLNRANSLAHETVLGMRDVGVRAAVARTTMDTGDGLPDSIKETPKRARAAVDDLLNDFTDDIAQSRVRIMTGPNTPGINASAQAVESIVEFARDRAIGISAHVAEYAEVRAAVQRTYDIDGVVRWLSTLGALGHDVLAVHAVQVELDEIPLLQESDTAISHNPFSNLFCGPRTAPASQYVAAGLRVGLGTDGAANNNGMDILDAARITRILERANDERPGISALETLRLATSGGARAVGLDGEIGKLEVGKHADIVLLSVNSPHMMPMFDPVAHIGYFGKGSDADTVIVDGRIVVREGRLVDVDVGDLRLEAGSAGRRLVGRLA